MKKPKAAKPKPKPAPAKPPAWHPVPVAQQRRQHRAAVKAAAARKKHPAPVKKTPAKKAVRKLALAGEVACCAAEALAASLRLAGWPVSERDVLALYRLTADGPDEGAAIGETLTAAAWDGLAGTAPASYGPVGLDDPAAVILGLDLPGPHAVCADGDTWWSWGEPHDPARWPGAVIEEAWAVTWPVTT